jgi:hypothetical protein
MCDTCQESVDLGLRAVTTCKHVGGHRRFGINHPSIFRKVYDGHKNYHKISNILHQSYDHKREFKIFLYQLEHETHKT